MTIADLKRDQLASTYAAIAANSILGCIAAVRRSELRGTDGKKTLLPVSTTEEMLDRIAESIGEMIPREKDPEAVSSLALIANRLSPEKA